MKDSHKYKNLDKAFQDAGHLLNTKMRILNDHAFSESKTSVEILQEYFSSLEKEAERKNIDLLRSLVLSIDEGISDISNSDFSQVIDFCVQNNFGLCILNAFSLILALKQTDSSVEDNLSFFGVFISIVNIIFKLSSQSALFSQRDIIIPLITKNVELFSVYPIYFQLTTIQTIHNALFSADDELLRCLLSDPNFPDYFFPFVQFAKDYEIEYLAISNVELFLERHIISIEQLAPLFRLLYQTKRILSLRFHIVKDVIEMFPNYFDFSKNKFIINSVSKHIFDQKRTISIPAIQISTKLIEFIPFQVYIKYFLFDYLDKMKESYFLHKPFINLLSVFIKFYNSEAVSFLLEKGILFFLLENFQIFNYECRSLTLFIFNDVIEIADQTSMEPIMNYNFWPVFSDFLDSDDDTMLNTVIQTISKMLNRLKITGEQNIFIQNLQNNINFFTLQELSVSNKSALLLLTEIMNNSC